MKAFRCFVILLVIVGTATVTFGQWTNRYPKVQGYRHHIYLEGFELPILAAGPSDPAPSPDGKSIAIGARGWLWLLNLESGVARRITSSRAMDSRPTWSPDGKHIAFLRDDTSDIDIWVLELSSGEEQPLISTSAIELDPAYSRDGQFLYYSSAEAGDLDIWRLQLATSERMPLTFKRGLEVRPLPLDGESFAYLAKGRSAPDSLVYFNDGHERTLRAQSIASQTHPGVSPDKNILVVNWPGPDSYDLLLVDVNTDDNIRLNARGRLPIAPSFSADGKTVYFIEANKHLQFELFSVATKGGMAKLVPIRSWDWGVPISRLEIRTSKKGNTSPVAARLHVVDDQGHPVVPTSGMPRFDMANGFVFFYSPGVTTVEVPTGNVQILAAHGFSSPVVTKTVAVPSGAKTVVELSFDQLWSPRDDGWYSGDHHYHMNYGGPYRLAPRDLVVELEGEDLDVGTPLIANLHHRFNDLDFFYHRKLAELPFLSFGQEIRSHFLGHLGLINIQEPYWPWYWGPGYPVYGSDDRPNHEALRFARNQGGVTSYMHPVSIAEPFGDEESLRSIPINLIPDAVLGDLDSMELACLWVNELGTHEVWYRFLNIGAPVAASAGTDMMADYYRTMAVGTTRVYVRATEPMTFESYLMALRQGRSFVSTGPLLDFRIMDRMPGDIVEEGLSNWTLRLASAVPVARVEILVNGEVVHNEKGLLSPGEQLYAGKLNLPAGGWVAARAHGSYEPDSEWPTMNGYPFAHSSPIWIGSHASTDLSAARKAAVELLDALAVAEQRLLIGYGGQSIPKLKARFAETRLKLEGIASR